jgi:3-oxoacyl-[acyl-carrier-protein] synthase II
MDSERTPVITGLGAVTPLGADAPSSWEGLSAGRDAEGPLTLFSTEGCRTHRAAMAPLPPLPGWTAKELSRLGRASRLAIPAAREALAGAGLLDAAGRSRLPILSLALSTTGGGMAFGEEFLRALGRRRARLLGPAARYQPQQQVLDLQRALAVAGPSFLVANACASGANALGHAAALVRAGAAECVLAGGFEALSELIFTGFDCLQATTTERCRPFDLHRSGLLLGEGAAFFVVESAAHARQRGAAPLCRLTGYGHTTDLYHLTQPQPEGDALVEVMERAARQAGVAPAEIGYVNAHGTATPVNDGAEARAYVRFFGEALGGARISSTKTAIGHTLGAAGAIEACFTIQALRAQRLPVQLHLRDPIPEVAAALVRAPAPPRPFAHAMSVNLGFGGSNAALLFSLP